ncbi:hypothetical protein F6R97_24505 [Pseudomonas sp. JV414]|uniref:hypothetical protein n=1 Tax=Pseudomonas sp. JV414 TaxID=1733110 RepID=UPI0028E12207|nr:hypothetical protein [Pseudomonas sp. JV414]MDT9677695.1 hypothetical protein [Pseudomonas sp. JV414]
MSIDRVLSKLHINGMTPLVGYDGQVTEPSLPIGLRAKVEGNQGYENGDSLTVFWNDIKVFEHSITEVEIPNGVLFQVEKRFITLGDVDAYYMIISSNGNSVRSPFLKLKVNPAA